jgi:hypothetical protein
MFFLISNLSRSMLFGLKAPWICVFTFKLLPIYLPISYAYNDILMIIF